ncbi:MAG TPA: two-component regulator propeller domain-containing protein [Verrucomicrobiae bacterium]|nr:two-component regulator propeller domain-containing protein [Verrucomicrobiae bacterium]
MLTGGVLSLAMCSILGAPKSAWFARSWQSEDGLPNNTVMGLAQTPDGYLWLGTPSGLVRFDGVRFEDFSPTNFVAPPNRGTLAMLLDKKEGLWLAMDRGAVVWLNGRQTQAFTRGLPEAIPSSTAQDAEGALWIGYHGGAVARLQNGVVTNLGLTNGLPEGTGICALAADKKGRIWFAKSGQVGMVCGSQFQTLHRFAPEPARLAAARSGGVWLCAGARLFHIREDGQAQDCGGLTPEVAGTTPNVLIEDHAGAVWIGTSFSGLFRYDKTGFESIRTTHKEILGLTEDREGNLWVGTGGGGLNRIRRRAVELQGSEEGLPFAAVQSICQDAQGTIWAATKNGLLARRVAGQWHEMRGGQNAPTDVTCVAADPNGPVWIGTRRGLFCWQDDHFVEWGDPKGLRGQTLHTLVVSHSGDLWIGEESPQAIQRLRAGQFTTFDIPQDCRVVRAMVEDAAGTVWAGTSKGVLFRIRGDQLAVATPRPPQDLASIRCLYATPDGALWIGYAGWGIGRLKAGHYAEISTEQGLFDNYISHIISDGHGWLWFGADRGIFAVRQDSLEAVAEGRSSRVHSTHYGRGQGMLSLQGNFGDSPDVLCSQDGHLWIPMQTALAMVDPSQLVEQRDPPPVLLDRVVIDGRLVAADTGVLPPLAPVSDLRKAVAPLRLAPGHRRIEFEFAALGFTDPQNIQFRYRLGGLDEDWRESGVTRSASYSRLPAGKYRFQVIACNPSGVWPQSGANLQLIVAPFLWQTWWFRVALLAALSLMLVATVRYVSFRRLHEQLRLLEQQAALHKERARIAKDIHDDLGANLTQIALLGELAQQDRAEPDKSAERVGRISATARQAIRSLDEIVWAVNPRNDTLAHLIDYAAQFALDYLRLAGIRCRLELPEQTPARQLSTDLRHNLFLAIKEALNNIVKHAQANEVWFRARVGAEALEVSIEDNGRGFAGAPDDALADGLRNMRQRLADIGGECRVQSQPGAGTVILLRLPWPADG